MNITNPGAAMAFTRFLRDMTRIMEGAVETDDLTLYLYVLAGIETASSPASDEAQLLLHSLLLDDFSEKVASCLGAEPPAVVQDAFEALRDATIASLLDTIEKGVVS